MSAIHPPRALAHGTGTEPVEPDWPPLTFEEVTRVLKNYPTLGAAREILSYSPRPFSAASLVGTSQGLAFVKRHHRLVRDVAGLLEEHRFMAYLRKGRFPVPEVFSTRDGASVVHEGEWTYEVHRASDGVDLYREAMSWTPFKSLEHAYAAGRTLAKLHAAATGYAAPPRKLQPLISSFTIFADVDPMTRMQAYIDCRPALAEYLAKLDWKGDVERVLLPFHSELLPYLGELTPLWGHNDFHASNLLWSDGSMSAQVETVIDFGLSDRTSSTYDIATAMERNIIDWLEIGTERDVLHLDQLDILLDGYESEVRLSPSQSDALIAILPLVHAEFALSEVDYFYGITHSVENARVAYETFFIGHAEWFNGDQGCRLLDHLRSRRDRLGF